jgi:hypothetical protein
MMFACKLQVVDFSTPLYSDKYHLFMVKPKESVSWTTFTDVFDKTFWVASLLTFIGLTFVLYISFIVSKVSNNSSLLILALLKHSVY